MAAAGLERECLQVCVVRCLEREKLVGVSESEVVAGRVAVASTGFSAGFEGFGSEPEILTVVQGQGFAEHQGRPAAAVAHYWS